MNPDFNSDKKNEILWKSISPVVQKIEKNKYELQLLKYFNFTDWVRTKFKN